MNLESVHEENAKYVFARLKLAQSLLEESDRLPGWSGYDLASQNEWWRHPRHERESLVNYLLLTCFDRLGQTRGFTTFKDWLSSKRKEHIDEREKALQTLKSSTSPLVIAASLAEHHQEIYGVRNSFYRGIESLSEEWQKKVLDSITVSFNPLYGTLGTNVSSPSYPLDDDLRERGLRLKHLYEKRNAFTHRLDQYFTASNSFRFSRDEEPLWKAMIKDSSLVYLSSHQEIESLKGGGAYVYSFVGWPFILFKALHSRLGSEFDRTEINIKFSVMLRRSSDPGAVITAEVSHDELKDFKSLESKLWDLRMQGLLPFGLDHRERKTTD